MDAKKILLCDVALSLYDKMTADPEIEDCYSEEDLNRVALTALEEISQSLHKVLSADDAEKIVTLVLEYGEFKGKEHFSEGFKEGLKLFKEIEEL